MYWSAASGGACVGCGYGSEDHRLCYLDRHSGLVYPAYDDDDPDTVEDADATAYNAEIGLGEVGGGVEVGDAPHAVGRPEIAIDVDRVKGYRDQGFKWVDIARSLLFVSVSTLQKWRVRVNYDRLERDRGRAVSDDHLRDILVEYMTCQEKRGYGSCQGFLVSINLHVPRARIRAMVRLINPQAVRDREERRIPRRDYDVIHYLHLAHLDGNHKLIGQGMVIHGMVDGATRKCLMLTVNNNNRARTVFQGFHESCERHGIPLRVRGDDGGENNMVEGYLNEQAMVRGLGELDGFIRGPSVHNTRIESFWGQMRPRCIQFWIDCFKKMSATNLPAAQRLTSTRIEHKFVLQWLFMPLIQHDLNVFVDTWNNHKLSTEKHFTPNQLQSMMLASQNHQPVPPVTVDTLTYGVEQLGLDLENAGQNRAQGGWEGQPYVDVQSPGCALTEAGMQMFAQRFPPVPPPPHLARSVDSYHAIFIDALNYYTELVLDF